MRMLRDDHRGFDALCVASLYSFDTIGFRAVVSQCRHTFEIYAFVIGRFRPSPSAGLDACLKASAHDRAAASLVRATRFLSFAV
jgi:hypothetical protein